MGPATTINTAAASGGMTDAPPNTAISPVDEVTKDELGKLLSHRPAKDELVEKGILKGGNLDPSLQAKQLELERHLLERKLKGALEERPGKEALVERNILKSGNTDPALQAKQQELSKALLEDKLNAALQGRPAPDELVKEGILTESEAPVIEKV